MHSIARLTCSLLVLLAASSLAAQDDAKLKAFLEKITSPDTDVRYAARSEGPSLGAAAVLPLARLMASAPEAVKDESLRIEISTVARLVLDRVVHHAGRPGADAERKSVAAELVRLLDPPHPDKVRREATTWLGAIGGDAEVPAVARLLGDKDRHVRETARLALERMPGAVALAALVEAAKAHGDEFQSDLVYSIGRRGDASAAPFLKGLARSGKGKTRLAALSGLARLGDADSAPLFAAALAEQDLPERGAVWNEYLRLADTLSESKKSSEAAGSSARRSRRRRSTTSASGRSTSSHATVERETSAPS